MKDVAEEETKEATRRWFNFLLTLHDIVQDQESKERGMQATKASDEQAYDTSG